MRIADPTILAKTRAEEHEADVWGKFYIPPYFNTLALKTATKSTYIVGKRGCGKTMLLKYLDYHTAFSPRRDVIPNDELKHIGIYWRVDTQFCNSLKYRGLEEHQWTSLFESYFSLVVAVEIIRAVHAIAYSSFKEFTLQDFEILSIPSASDFHPNFPTSPVALEAHLERTRRQFTTWISNMSSMSQPILPPGRPFIDALIADLKKVPGLTDAAFYVYVDEVENLVLYQRRVLNSLLKHSQKPFIVSFTSKELSSENATTGSESVNATHDFRLLSLDTMLVDTNRSVFFAEVYLANLDIAAGTLTTPLLQSVLSPERLAERSASAYRESIMKTMHTRFPSKTNIEVAADAIQEPRIFNILKERIEQALAKKQGISTSDFLEFTDIPEALVIVPALLNRRSLMPKKILNELNSYRESRTGAFKTTWIHNNLVGALLELYRPYGHICPIYSGFDTFCTMANNNLRHFLILCYKTLEVAELTDENIEVFSIKTQARAAFEAAEKLIGEIRTFGELSERLRVFVLRIGNLFRGYQAQPAMSEPEQNQFTINSGARAVSAEELQFLREAMKYAILIEQLETKTKNTIGSDVVDYQLNPIYAPYFQISYRRKRKIEISVEDFHSLALGTETENTQLMAKLLKRDGAAESHLQMGLWT